VITVRVPASSANLGPGFDALGMALDLHADVGVVEASIATPWGARVVDERHPADIAFRVGGGEGRLWVRSPIPMGRGLGYSGAMRVGGLLAAVAQRGPAAVEGQRLDILRQATELEGHPDNVAASLVGGFVATAAGRVVRIPSQFAPAVLAWVPPTTMATARSRSSLGHSVSFDDAVFNVGRAALLVAALAAGDIDALTVATADRLHQDLRFSALAPSREALAAGLEAGAWCGWLSGSGPTVVLLCDPAEEARIAEALPTDEAHVKQLRVDTDGAQVTAY
jgi:homoserine kinase